MTREELIRAALAYDEATEDYPFGDDLLTVKVGGRVFAWIPLTDSGWVGSGCRVAIKAPPATILELHDAYPDEVAVARPLAERHWVAVRIGGRVSDEEVLDLIGLSYSCVVAGLPRRRRPGADSVES
ncbi:MAG TPA: MmcQ/YjbR family DNA-binding protein [Nocardioidaceae bacterium]|nr:MmcQ/YjbR family DNA-binding protein [Nocardioidaceae bacterium]